MSTEDKGEWASTADEGIVPAEENDAAFIGRTTGSDEPATESGVDLSAGDNADAVRDGGAEPPEEAEPDLKDAAAMPRKVDADSAA
jgi:hypothetical protein